MYVYKAALRSDNDQDCIVVLTLPANTRVRLSDNATGKCRASAAKVIRLETLAGAVITGTSAYAGHDNSFKYHPGKIVRPRRAFATSNTECASGIHFFFKRTEAVAWARG